MLNTLVHRQDRNEAGASHASGVENPLNRTHNLRRAVGLRDNAVDEVGPGQMKLVL